MAKEDDLHTLRQAIKALADVLKSMTAKEKDAIPTGNFGENYNRLRKLAIELAPETKLEMWPPEIEFADVSGNRVCKERFIEIRSYVGLLLAVIPPEEPFGYIGVG